MDYGNQNEKLWQSELNRARFLGEQSLKNAIIGRAEKIAGKLNETIDRGHANTAFLLALILAFLKDSLDIILDFPILGFPIGEIPILGQLPGLLISTTLYIFLSGKG